MAILPSDDLQQVLRKRGLHQIDQLLRTDPTYAKLVPKMDQLQLLEEGTTQDRLMELGRSLEADEVIVVAGTLLPASGHAVAFGMIQRPADGAEPTIQVWNNRFALAVNLMTLKTWATQYPTYTFQTVHAVLSTAHVGRGSGKLAAELKLSPYFPEDEVALLPKHVPTTGSVANDAAFVCTVEELKCSETSLGRLTRYCDVVPRPQRNLRRIIVQGNPDLGKKEVKEALQLVFGKDSVAHTAVFVESSTATATTLIEMNLPGLSCLVLRKSTEVDATAVLEKASKNKHLQELSFDACVSHSSDMIKIVLQCKHICFDVKPDLNVPPPRVLANAVEATFPDLVPVPQFQAKGAKDVVGLLTAYYKVVPLQRKHLPHFKTLEAMLKSEEGGAGDSTPPPMLPMEMDPPVSAKTVCLAVLFVEQYLPAEMAAACFEKEGHDAVGPGGYTWCHRFSQFRDEHINAQCSNHRERLLRLCELMGVATYLNCPSLKQFLRAAIVVEDATQ